jgi:hypothetical protein
MVEFSVNQNAFADNFNTVNQLTARQALMSQYGPAAGDPTQTQGVLANQQALVMNPLLVQQQGLVNTNLGLKNQLDQGMIAPTVQTAYGNAGAATAAGQTALSTMPSGISSKNAANYAAQYASMLGTGTAKSAAGAAFLDLVYQGVPPDEAARRAGIQSGQDPNAIKTEFGGLVGQPGSAVRNTTQALKYANLPLPDQANTTVALAGVPRIATDAAAAISGTGQTSASAASGYQSAAAARQALQSLTTTGIDQMLPVIDAMPNNIAFNDILTRMGGAGKVVQGYMGALVPELQGLAASGGMSPALSSQINGISTALGSGNKEQIKNALLQFKSLGPTLDSVLSNQQKAAQFTASTTNPNAVMGTANSLTGAVLGTTGTAAQQPGQPTAPLPPQQWGFTKAPDGSTVSLSALGSAIKTMETGSPQGDYNNVNSIGAHGAGQVMYFNIPAWTKQYYGQTLTPEQFLANPRAQDTVLQGFLSDRVPKVGLQGAAGEWFAGTDWADKARRGITDHHSTIPNYISTVLGHYRDYLGVEQQAGFGQAPPQAIAPQGQQAAAPQGQQAAAPQGQQAAAPDPAVAQMVAQAKSQGRDPAAIAAALKADGQNPSLYGF